MKFRLPRLPDADDLINKVVNELTGSEFVLDIKDMVLDEVKKELKPMAIGFLEEVKQELIETASEQLCSIIYESLLDGLGKRELSYHPIRKLRLRAQMEGHKVSMRTIADAAGVAAPTIQKIEMGHIKRPKAETLEKVAKYFSQTFDEPITVQDLQAVK